jgi:hypothetical protein
MTKQYSAVVGGNNSITQGQIYAALYGVPFVFDMHRERDPAVEVLSFPMAPGHYFLGGRN